MPTLEELRQERYWRNEFVPESLKVLREKLIGKLGISHDGIGIIGDAKHLRGYHRSRAWIKHSRYCTNRSYSVTETEGNKSGGSDDAVSGMDILLPEEQAKRVYVALKGFSDTDRWRKIRQVYVERNPTHVHISFDRGLALNAHADILAIICRACDSKGRTVKLSLSMPELRVGSTGRHVSMCQSLLTLSGFPTQCDGIFGPKTAESTRRMQAKVGARHVDGIWGPETWTIALEIKALP